VEIFSEVGLQGTPSCSGVWRTGGRRSALTDQRFLHEQAVAGPPVSYGLLQLAHHVVQLPTQIGCSRIGVWVHQFQKVGDDIRRRNHCLCQLQVFPNDLVRRAVDLIAQAGIFWQVRVLVWVEIKGKQIDAG
jgi:hypothetical protein